MTPALGGAVMGGQGIPSPQGPAAEPPLPPLQNGVISLIDCTLVEEPESTDEDGTWWGGGWGVVGWWIKFRCQ